jgi:hypothetical protein
VVQQVNGRNDQNHKIACRALLARLGTTESCHVLLHFWAMVERRKKILGNEEKKIRFMGLGVSGLGNTEVTL